MLKHLYAGSIIIVGGWLPYDELFDLDVFIIKLNKFSKEQLLNSFKQSIVNLNDYKKFLKNKDIAFKIEFKGNWQKIVEAIKIWKSQQG